MGKGNGSGITGTRELEESGDPTRGEEEEVGNPFERMKDFDPRAARAQKFENITSLDNPALAQIAETMKEPNFSHVWARFDGASDLQLGFFYYSACMQNEAGEVFNHAKKALVKGKPIDPNEIGDELVDVLWYVLACASMLNIELSDAAQKKCDELITRIRSGYYKGDSHNA